MLLRTSNEKEYKAVWADVASSGVFFAHVFDDRPIPQVAADFDGLAWLERESAEQGDKRFDGFSVLMGVERITGEVVKLTIGKGESNV